MPSTGDSRNSAGPSARSLDDPCVTAFFSRDDIAQTQPAFAPFDPDGHAGSCRRGDLALGGIVKRSLATAPTNRRA
jgi:hypothetical protein